MILDYSSFKFIVYYTIIFDEHAMKFKWSQLIEPVENDEDEKICDKYSSPLSTNYDRRVSKAGKLLFKSDSSISWHSTSDTDDGRINHWRWLRGFTTYTGVK